MGRFASSFFFWLFVLSGPVWSGPAGGGVSRTEKSAWLAGSCGFVLWGWLVVCGVGNTPAAALWGGGGCPLRVWGVACCRGSGAVRPGCLARASAACLMGGGVWVWVGWL